MGLVCAQEWLVFTVTKCKVPSTPAYGSLLSSLYHQICRLDIFTFIPTPKLIKEGMPTHRCIMCT